jgi:hypothetical protein
MVDNISLEDISIDDNSYNQWCADIEKKIGLMIQ